MDSLNAFTVFVQVAETRSFTAAGRLLGISASAVGKSVARLEEKLGVRLFHRSTRSITPTAEGLLLLERSRRILAEIEAAQTELSQASSAPRGRLRVSLPLVSTLVLPVLADFMRDYPDIQLDLDFSDRLVDVVEEGFDAVVRTGEPADSRLVARKLGHFKMLLVASPDYIAAHGMPRQVQDLQAHQCMHFRWPHSPSTCPSRWSATTSKPAPALRCGDAASPACPTLRSAMRWLMAGWCRSCRGWRSAPGCSTFCGLRAGMQRPKSGRWWAIFVRGCLLTIDRIDSYLS